MRYLILIILFSSQIAIAQEDYYNKSHLRYDDYVYSENIKSVQLYKKNDEYSIPMIALGSQEQLQLAFDDLESGMGTYNYSFILCNNDWTPADLMPMEYIEGLTSDYFNNTHQSFNTTIHYTHYETLLPSPEIKITKSGNYLLKVYPDGEPDNPIITRRFYVYQNLVSVEAEAFLAKAPQDRNHKQEIFIKINTNQYPMPDIYGSLTVKVQQNGRKDNIKTLHKPKIITANYLYYNGIGDIVFDGGNEFRKMDIRSFRIQSARMASLTYDSSGYQIQLLPDAIRAHKNYLNYQDINGQFGVINWDDPHLSEKIESDYGFVHFTLPVPIPYEDGEIYLLGNFTNWRMDAQSKLNYNKEKKAYETTLILKQGYYDYNYIFVPNGKTEGDISRIEGNHSETENMYHVFVYYRDQGEMYDKLISVQSFSSKN